MLIFTIIIFLIIPFYSIPFILIGLFGEKNNNKIIFAGLFAIVISIILFDMIPKEDMDLFRYYEMMEEYKNIPTENILSFSFSKIEPVMNLIFIIFSKFTNHHLLIFFVSFVSYYIQFYIIFDYQKTKKINNNDLNIVLLFFISTFLMVSHITGIRLCLGRLIFLLALYRDYYKNDKSIINKLLYIIPLFIHQSLIIMLLLRVFMYFNKNKFNLKTLVLLIAAALSPNIIVNLTSYLSTNLSSFSLLTSRAKFYLLAGNKLDNIYILQFALMLFSCIVIAFMKKNKLIANSNFLNYTLTTFAIGFLFSYSLDISIRYITIACSFMPIIFIDLYSKINKKKKVLVSLIIIAFSIVYIIFQLIQLNMGTYRKIFTYDSTISSIALIALFLFLLMYTFNNRWRKINEKQNYISNSTNL